MWFSRKRVIHEIAPDEIFLDSSNLPGYDAGQFEGRVVHRLSQKSIVGVGVVFCLVTLIFSARVFSLEIMSGKTYATISRENTLEHSIIFVTRGRITDRTGQELAWNEEPSYAMSSLASSSSAEVVDPRAIFALRKYTEKPGLSHILGYVQYPKADKDGVWWRQEYTGISGVELAYDSLLGGTNGKSMIERDARGDVQRENIVVPPTDGVDVRLSIDASVQSHLYTLLSEHARKQGFKGGAAVIMDVHTGELLALTSFPEYDNQAFTDGDSSAIRASSNDSDTPLLNRAVSGLYVPGSIVKPIFAAAALNEKIISPEKEILSTGAITLPNPYNPDQPSIFRDWTVHGLVDMRTAIAVSSDEYFYTIGGGYKGQRGLGIAKIDEYSRLFGLSEKTGIALRGELAGVIPTPEWKAEVFGPDDPWRIGNTYHTSIGQYGFQITPLQAVVFTAAIANGGKRLVPTFQASSTPQYEDIGIPDEYLQIAREGMRMAVTSPRTDATVKSLYIPEVHIAAKSGTAQLGVRNEFMNSWSVGFWPSEKPRFAYAVVLERAPAGTLSGASPALLPFFRWLAEHHPEYID